MVFIEKTLVGKLLKKMRIISGILKGKSLNFLRNPNTRPLKELRERKYF